MKSRKKAARHSIFAGVEPEPVIAEEFPTEEDLKAFAEWFASCLEVGDFLGLIGDLGAGKTTFMKGFVQGRSGGDETQVSSPTYSLVQEYPLSPLIFHMDLYRLESIEDLEGIGYWDYLDGPEIVCVEWLDRIEEAWPGEGWLLFFDKLQDGRRLTIYADIVRRERFEGFGG